MKNQNKFSSNALWIGAIGLVAGLIVAYAYFSYAPAQDSGDTASSTPNGGALSGSLVQKSYTNLQYGYSLKYPGDAQNSVSHPDAVSFSFAGANNTKGTLAINTAIDVTHVAFCLSTPGGSSNVATTTINGVAFHSYVAMKSSSDVAATTHYKVVRKATSGMGSVCYDIMKTSNASQAINTKLDGILRSITFK